MRQSLRQLSGRPQQLASRCQLCVCTPVLLILLRMRSCANGPALSFPHWKSRWVPLVPNPCSGKCGLKCEKCECRAVPRQPMCLCALLTGAGMRARHAHAPAARPSIPSNSSRVLLPSAETLPPAHPPCAAHVCVGGGCVCPKGRPQECGVPGLCTNPMLDPMVSQAASCQALDKRHCSQVACSGAPQLSAGFPGANCPCSSPTPRRILAQA